MTAAWLSPLLDRLEAELGAFSLADHLRIQRALEAPGPWDRARLRLTLRALLARTKDLQARFDTCFDACVLPDDEFPPDDPHLRALLTQAIEALEPQALVAQVHQALDPKGQARQEAESEGALSGAHSHGAHSHGAHSHGAQYQTPGHGGPAAHPPGAPDAEKDSAQRRRLWLSTWLRGGRLWLLGGFFLLVVAWGICAWYWHWPPWDAAHPVVQGAPSPIESAEKRMSLPSAAPDPVRRLQLLRLERVERLPQLDWFFQSWLTWLVGLITLLVGTVLSVWAWSQRPPKPKGSSLPEAQQTQPFRLAEGPPERLPWLSGAVLDRLSDALGHAEVEELSDVLQPDQSIRATAAAGGFPTPCFEPQKLYRRVLVLCEVLPPELGWHPLPRQLVFGLRERRVEVLEGSYERDPSRWFRDDRLETLEALGSRRGQTLVLVLGRLQTLPKGREGHRLRQRLLAGPSAVIELGDPTQWSERPLERWIQADIPVVPGTERGIRHVCEALQGGQRWKDEARRLSRRRPDPNEGWLWVAAGALWQPLPLSVALWLHGRLREHLRALSDEAPSPAPVSVVPSPPSPASGHERSVPVALPGGGSRELKGTEAFPGDQTSEADTPLSPSAGLTLREGLASALSLPERTRWGRLVTQHGLRWSDEGFMLSSRDRQERVDRLRQASPALLTRLLRDLSTRVEQEATRASGTNHAAWEARRAALALMLSAEGGLDAREQQALSDMLRSLGEGAELQALKGEVRGLLPPVVTPKPSRWAWLGLPDWHAYQEHDLLFALSARGEPAQPPSPRPLVGLGIVLLLLWGWVGLERWLEPGGAVLQASVQVEGERPRFGAFQLWRVEPGVEVCPGPGCTLEGEPHAWEAGEALPPLRAEALGSYALGILSPGGVQLERLPQPVEGEGWRLHLQAGSGVERCLEGHVLLGEPSLGQAWVVRCLEEGNEPEGFWSRSRAAALRTRALTSRVLLVTRRESSEGVALEPAWRWLRAGRADTVRWLRLDVEEGTEEVLHALEHELEALGGMAGLGQLLVLWGGVRVDAVRLEQRLSAQGWGAWGWQEESADAPLDSLLRGAEGGPQSFAGLLPQEQRGQRWGASRAKVWIFQEGEAPTPTPVTPSPSPVTPSPALVTPTAFPVTPTPTPTDIVFVQVPGTGPEGFWMGSKDGEGKDSERPRHKVVIQPFQLSKTEVTVAQYKACVDAEKCSEPKTGTYCNWNVPGRAQHPINCVEWNQAQAYAAWLSTVVGGKVRLPTEAEWEYAARGNEERKYPWGSAEPDCTLASFDPSSSLDSSQWGCGTGSTSEVGRYPKGASWVGALDMAGNVWEWVEDCWHESYTNAPQDGSAWTTSCSDSDRQVFRGGSWLGVPLGLRGAFRSGSRAGVGSWSRGFRVAWLPPAGHLSN